MLLVTHRKSHIEFCDIVEKLANYNSKNQIKIGHEDF